jgi:hypothetical protein
MSLRVSLCNCKGNYSLQTTDNGILRIYTSKEFPMIIKRINTYFQTRHVIIVSKTKAIVLVINISSVVLCGVRDRTE